MALTVKVNVERLRYKLSQLVDDKVMLQVHNTFAKMCDPYVPMDEGYLSQSVHVTPQYVQYQGPYAHYMYMGEVYGPNIPIRDEDGLIIGWFSPPGQPKYPTGKAIQYNTEKHPLATKEWDKAMMRDKGDEFKLEVTRILRRKASEIDGRP